MSYYLRNSAKTFYFQVNAIHFCGIQDSDSTKLHDKLFFLSIFFYYCIELFCYDRLAQQDDTMQRHWEKCRK